MTDDGTAPCDNGLREVVVKGYAVYAFMVVPASEIVSILIDDVETETTPMPLIRSSSP